jgi:hypothetical protein
MRDVELYRRILGLEMPWTVTRVDLLVTEQRVDRGGPQTLDSVAASLRWSPLRVVMPPCCGFGHRGEALSR